MVHFWVNRSKWKYSGHDFLALNAPSKNAQYPSRITTLHLYSRYKSRDDFIADVRLIFDNCEIFNEDDSPVGKAGHGMRKFFEVRWAELTDKHSWYSNLMHFKYLSEWSESFSRNLRAFIFNLWIIWNLFFFRLHPILFGLAIF